jgi:hypothetical protein
MHLCSCCQEKHSTVHYVEDLLPGNPDWLQTRPGHGQITQLVNTALVCKVVLYFKVESETPIIQIHETESGCSAAVMRYMIVEFTHWRRKASRIPAPAVAGEVSDG